MLFGASNDERELQASHRIKVASTLLVGEHVLGLIGRVDPNAMPLEASLEGLHPNETMQLGKRKTSMQLRQSHLNKAIANMTNRATRTIKGAETLRLRNIV